MKVVASLGYEGTVAVPTRDPAVDAAGARQRGVLQNMAVHLCWLVQVARRVVFWEKSGILSVPKLLNDTTLTYTHTHTHTTNTIIKATHCACCSAGDSSTDTWQ